MSSRPETTVKTPKGKSKKKTAKERSFLFEKNSTFEASVKTRKCRKISFAGQSHYHRIRASGTSRNAPPCGNVAYNGRKVLPLQLRLLFCRVARGNFVGQRQRERILHYGRSCDGIAAANYAGAIVWRSRVGRNVVILQFVFTADAIRPVFRESKNCSLFRGLLLSQTLTKEGK